MTNVQLYLAMAVPAVMVLIGILLNRSDNAALRTEISQMRETMRTEIRTEIGQLRNEVRGEIGQLRGEMVSLRDSIHRDMVMLHERVAVVESKQA